ncbi:DUF1566 domain-containing protein [Halomonas lysinitropha]|uniref:Lcl C-terminal domain-containing protein n=1 Tax=Halomonas lysinitropha TaxID=2607506 RepID=A0A5K1I5A2_9GAMM|nr:DUF1566 domain-containing protein [Halomonas lysinitropha]VVZ94352.1 hypothetical protein HALO32_00402 [Halomonas lysinitropha]
MRRGPLTLLTMLIVAPLALGNTAERFRFPADGLVTDEAQSLMWMRCSMGQTFHEQGCRGEAASVGLDQADAYAAAQASADCPWRLPRFFELRSLMQEPDDTAVAIDSTAFPDTPHGWYWNQVSAGGHSQQDCFVDFTGNGRTRCNMAGDFHVRLVMDLDASTTPASCSTP